MTIAERWNEIERAVAHGPQADTGHSEDRKAPHNNALKPDVAKASRLLLTQKPRRFYVAA